MLTICGSGGRDGGFSQGKCLTEAVFSFPLAICIDPIHPRNFFVGDRSSVRYVDAATDRVSLIAGGAEETSGGFADGIGAAAGFGVVSGLVCTMNSERLYATDSSDFGRIRMIDVATRTVTTIAGGGQLGSQDGIGLKAALLFPARLVFDRSSSVRPESVLYITEAFAIRKLVLDTAQVTTITVDRFKPSTDTAGHYSPSFQPRAIACLPTGSLLVGCNMTRAIYWLDPHSGDCKLLAGSGVPWDRESPFMASSGVGWDQPVRHADGRFSDFALVEDERCVWISDTNNRCIRCMTLPASVFA